MKAILKKITHLWSKYFNWPVFLLWYMVRREVDIGIRKDEAKFLYKQVKKTKHIKGAMAEIGVWRGGSAMIIRRAEKKKPFYLIDTFSGFKTEEHQEIGMKGDSFKNTSYEMVKNYFKGFKNTYVTKGRFPTGIVDTKYSFVHLDIDTYQTTRECLGFFVSRMNHGGRIVIHDYSHFVIAGVKQAVNEIVVKHSQQIIISNGVGSYISLCINNV